MIVDRPDLPAQAPSVHPPAPRDPSQELENQVKPLLDQLNRVATAHAGDPIALLSLLRQLEHLHRSIQDGAFRASLPSDRGPLFQLLQNMELSGGWPYIPRLQLRTFLDLLQSEESHDLINESPAEGVDAA